MGLAGWLSIALLVGCGLTADAPPDQPPYHVVSQDYLPGVQADVYLPDGVSAAPVVVLVPGGAWLTADRTGLTPLAKRLAGEGIVAVNTTHRAVNAGARFPQPVSDVLCSIDFAAHRAAQAGIAPTLIVVLGHSSGAHLAALAALGGDSFRTPSCSYPPVQVDGLVGLAGPYDVLSLPGLAEPLFGTSPGQDPTTWRLGNPIAWAGQGAHRSTLHVLLAHGTADTDLSATFTTQFADVLRTNGYDISLDMVDGATHQSLYAAPVIGPHLVSWLDARLAASPAPRVRQTPSRRPALPSPTPPRGG